MMLFIYIIYITFLKTSSNDNVTEKPFEEIMLNKEMAKPNLDTTQQKVAQLELARQTPSIIKNTEEKVNNLIKTQPQDLELKIVASDKSWIRVVVDEKDNNEFILTNGMTKVLNADKQYFLHIGNSGAVKLFLNNKELEFSKELNRVRKLIVKKDGIEYLRRPSTN
ncbi:MAG: DUF4115 domain-containing protein [Ignavibacteriales bacterium]|nr:DUF4115 domain-containing protein [Ignavibacteriales bacterium]